MKSKFDTLYEQIISEQSEVLEEAKFSKIPKKRLKKSTVDKRVKDTKSQKPIDQNRHDMKLSRGQNRSRQSFTSRYKQITHNTGTPVADRILKTAKTAREGIWKLSPRQVVEIAAKYKFNVPNKKKRSKHLGSTGIVMWRKDSNSYYLVKLGKHKGMR